MRKALYHAERVGKHFDQDSRVEEERLANPAISASIFA
jgi:hypothetical protein